MSRRARNQSQQNNDSLLFELNRLKSTPLGQVFSDLQEGLIFMRQVFQAGGCSKAQFEAVTDQIRDVFQLIPQEFTDRFWFDAQMIHTIKASWNGQGQRLSHLVIPVSAKEWAHRKVASPVRLQRGQEKPISLIHFPGDNHLDGVDLLDYPFLHHELAHNLYLFDDSFFRGRFDEKLNELITKLRLQSISDHGSAKISSERVRQEIDTYWRPMPTSHHNWAHEIAMDLTALWTCGPAYLTALNYELNDDRINPYLITQEHPPYAVRVEALITTCDQLGWGAEAVELGKKVQQWQRSEYQQHKNNRYIGLANLDLIAHCARSVLVTCQHQNLPRCDKATIKRIENKIKRGETPDWGTELILAAWLKFESDEANYAAWQQTAVRELLDSLTP